MESKLKYAENVDSGFFGFSSGLRVNFDSFERPVSFGASRSISVAPPIYFPFLLHKCPAPHPAPG